MDSGFHSYFKSSNDYNLMSASFFFFFSSRRRHTRLVSDWSSDVCSSDLRSTTSHFTVVSRPSGCVVPDRPTILAPGEVSTGIPYKVRWLPALGAGAYVVQEANNASFTGSTTFPATIDNKLTFIHPSAGTFFYRVRGISDCTTEPGPYSAIVGISILPQSSNEGAASPDAPVTITYSIPLD